MKITKNTSGYSTRELKRIICKVHAHIRKLEGRDAPRWKRLEVHVRGRDDNYTSGRAFYNGCGYVDSWDVVFTIPRAIKKGATGYWKYPQLKGKLNNYRARRFAYLAYHELMHTYGYRHHQFTNINDAELEKLFPDDYVIPTAQELAKPKAPKPPVYKTRYARIRQRRKQWEAKQRRAKTALGKLAKQAAYYERKYTADELR